MANPSTQNGVKDEQALQQKQKTGVEQRSSIQIKVSKFYNSFKVQTIVACLIFANFLTNMLEKEIDPRGTLYSKQFQVLEVVYNILFTIELGLNMFSSQCATFWRSGWNVFDVIVVSIGLMDMLKLSWMTRARMLRMMRAFRVFRLFKRVKSLNKIINALAHAVPGVINAFVLLTIVMCIYAILAVEFYQDVGEGCHRQDAELPPSYRGECFGEEYFGSFSRSFFSFFQVLTGESWSEAIARPVIVWADNGLMAAASAAFFVSFVLVTLFVLTNVVVAVLLDKMVDPEVNAASSSSDDTSEDSGSSTAEMNNGKSIVQDEMDNSQPSEGGISGHVRSCEDEIRRLALACGELRKDMDTEKQERRAQFEAVLAAVADLKESSPSWRSSQI